MSRQFRRLPATLLSIALALAALVAMAEARTQAARPVSFIAALRTARAQTGAPGASAAVVACGKLLWAGYSGVTDVRSRRPVTSSTLYVTASTTKTVVATMVMQLIQAGRLSLDTPLSRFYPQLPNASRITVRMLLDMTSGLPEYLNNPRIRNTIQNDPEHVWTRDEVLSNLGPAQFAPGTSFRYTDTNYIALGGIVEQVTGKTIESDFQRRIARPAGMRSSSFVPTPGGTRRLAHPYSRASSGALTDTWIRGYGLGDDNWGPVWTDGGLASTATDLARFGDSLFAGHLVRRGSLAEMTNTGSNNYGFGIFGQSFDGHNWLGHNGAYGGYESENFTDPSRRVTVAVTTDVENSGDGFDSVAERIWRAVVQALDGSSAASCRA